MKTVIFPNENATEFREILANMVGNDPQEGYTISEVRTGMAVLDKIEAAQGPLVFEDSEFTFIQRRLARVKFKMIDKKVVAFIDAFTGAHSADSP